MGICCLFVLIFSQTHLWLTETKTDHQTLNLGNAYRIASR
uniref:Uncharacterized protein n=1 Tax=Rhizophora mucronata TaxID=61149 RepID=A0A2P2MZB1_RHIMU